MGLRIGISGFGSQDFDLLVCASGFVSPGLGLRIWISVFCCHDFIFAFGSEDLNIWVCVSGVGSMGLGLRIWISGFGSQDLNP